MKFPKFTPNETVFGFIYFLLQLIVIPGILLAINMMLPNPMSEAVVNFIFFAANFLVVLLIFRKFLGKNLQSLRERPWYVLRCAGLGLLIYMAGNGIFSFVVTPLFPDFANINDAAIMEMVQEHFGLMTVGTVLFVPLAEECFYRGLIFRNLYDKHPAWAYILSMTVFSLAHVVGYVTMADFGTLVLCFFQYLPAAFALSWCYRRCGCIFAPVLVHMAVNQTGMLLMR